MNNNQEAFNKIWTFISAQGKQSMNPDGNCQYRGPDGMQCAVGCLIPNDEYITLLDDGSLVPKEYHNGLQFAQALVPSLQKYDLAFLEDMQRFHDFVPNTEPFLVTWQSSMREYAAENNLTVPGDSNE